MNLKKSARRTMALGRRKADVEMYERLKKVPVPTALYGVVYEVQSAWDKLIERKLKLAKAEVVTLEAVRLTGL